MFNLLIVDDEPLVRRGIKAFIDFEALSIAEVYEAENGEEALNIFNSQTIHIILADINMPKMNGLDFAKKVKELAPETKIALITGYDYFDYAVTALKSGVDDYVLKPVSKKDIQALLFTLVERCKEANRQHAVEQIAPVASGETAQDDYGSQLRELIQNNITNPELSLGFLGDEIGLSTGYLSGVFKKQFGLPFQDYVLKYRLEQAKIFLLTTNMKNYEIAEAIGFDDPGYFSLRFKKHYGVSPKQFKSQAEG